MESRASTVAEYLSDNKHGYFRFREYTSGSRSEHQAGQRTATMGPHKNEVEIALLGDLADVLNYTSDMMGFGKRHTGLFQPKSRAPKREFDILAVDACDGLFP